MCKHEGTFCSMCDREVDSAIADREAEVERLRGLLREVRMYALGNDVSTQLLMERVDAALAERGE